MKWWDPRTWSVFKKMLPRQYERNPLTKSVSDIPPGAIILCSSNKWDLISWIIRKVTHARVSHALMYFGSGKHETIEAEPKGVVRDTLDKRINSYDMMWIYVMPALTVQQLQVIKAYAYGSVGRMYDYVGVVEFVLGGDTDSESRNFCSENVVLAFKETGIQISVKEPDKSAPGDLQKWFESHVGQWQLWDTQNVKKV